MKRFVIDRFEGSYAVCEDADQNCVVMEVEKLPPMAKEGCVLTISEEGEIFLDTEETERRRQRIAEKQRRLFE